uniref:Secreted protein n=1 Tax=Nelumbo nucifera TaxID=4432 RepID=A0A822ZAG2_NELNU|nr:TPA_asm: hypothetical protein HUJ06_014742 [Nelumbo nucifera]
MTRKLLLLLLLSSRGAQVFGWLGLPIYSQPCLQPCRSRALLSQVTAWIVNKAVNLMCILHSWCRLQIPVQAGIDDDHSSSVVRYVEILPDVIKKKAIE